MKFTHFLYVPFTGLGKYNGYRGDRWLKNRLKVFRQFVVPSLNNQSTFNFIVWISWRPEEKYNQLVLDFIEQLKKEVEVQVVHTFHGVCFYDDKYDDYTAQQRLLYSVKRSTQDLTNEIPSLVESDYVYMTIQPSDDLYEEVAVEGIQRIFEKTEIQATGFQKGYITNYWTGELAEYNPTTNPPFYTLKFPAEAFLSATEHLKYTSLKIDIEKYKAGTPLPSHEYVGDCLKYVQIPKRGFMVGTHLENISTTWKIPFKGNDVAKDQKNEIFSRFGILGATRLHMTLPLWKKIYFSLPYKWQRKLRYWITEKFQ